MMILALDLGSTHLKAGAFDAGPSPLGVGKQPFTYRKPSRPGGAEFDPEEFLTAVRKCIHGALGAAGADGPDVTALAITSQAQTFTITDMQNKPRRPFTSWMDWSAGAACAEMSLLDPWSRFGEHTSFSELLPPLTVCLLQHLKTNGLLTLGEGGIIQFLPTFLCSMLGAEPVVDRNLAALSGLYSLKDGDWWDKALAFLGVEKGNLPRLCETGAVCGETGGEALGFGLRSGVPIVLAGNDQTAGAYGAELHRNGALLVTLGTAHVAYAHRKSLPGAAPGLVRGPYPGGSFYQMAAESRGGNVVDWAVRELLGELRRDEFFALASQSPPGAGGLRFTPDPRGNGKWSRGRDNQAAPDLARSVIEGLAGIVRQMIDKLSPACRGEVLVAGGGGTQPVWLEVLHQETGLRMKRTPADPLGGAARMAAEGLRTNAAGRES